MARAAAAGTWVFAREWRRVRHAGAEPRSDAAARALGRAFVHAATRLGATFIKVGQIASTRADLLPRPLVAELMALQDRVPPFPFEQARRTIEADLGKPIESVFREIDPEPLAAASVAQVHRAVLRSTGEPVAVKIRRPDVVEKIELDRAILLFLGGVLERVVPSLRLVSLREALRTFGNAVEEQTSLTAEARNNARFRAALTFADDPDIGFPRLVPEACSDAVLTMELIEGVREQDLEAQGLDVRRIVSAGMRAVCRMIFLHGFVHADLHPGNLRFLPPGRVIFLDLGLVGTLVDADRLSSRRSCTRSPPATG